MPDPKASPNVLLLPIEILPPVKTSRPALLLTLNDCIASEPDKVKLSEVGLGATVAVPQPAELTVFEENVNSSMFGAPSAVREINFNKLLPEVRLMLTTAVVQFV